MSLSHSASPSSGSSQLEIDYFNLLFPQEFASNYSENNPSYAPNYTENDPTYSTKYVEKNSAFVNKYNLGGVSIPELSRVSDSISAGVSELEIDYFKLLFPQEFDSKYSENNPSYSDNYARKNTSFSEKYSENNPAYSDNYSEKNSVFVKGYPV